jgi:carbamoyl-phosphate synthase large subunit
LAENRDKFGKFLDVLKIPVPKWGTAFSVDEALVVAHDVGYPVMVRPSYVLGGRGMEIVYDDDGLKTYVGKAALVSGEHPILVDAFLEDAFEFDVDALCDGTDVFVAGIMQHIEKAGIHSGDSACVLPAYELTSKSRKMIEDYTKELALCLNTIGLINIQFATKNDVVYVIEVNPRASRTVPFISKVIDLPLAKLAAQLAVGKKLSEMDLESKSKNGLIAVKKPVFPFNKFPQQNVFLSPEMKSTGEVIGFDKHLGSAFAKAEAGAGNSLPEHGTLFISVNNSDKVKAIPLARDFQELGFEIMATSGTARLLNENGITARHIFKVGEGRPNVVDAIKNGEIQLVVNTPMGAQAREDEYEIGRSAIRYKVPAITTISGAQAAVRGIRNIKSDSIKYRSLQEVFG